MTLPIQLLSTDFDGTLFAEFENPPIPPRLEQLIGEMQAAGTKWVINTGREMSSLMEALGRSKLRVQPDYLVLVEREMFIRQEHRFVAMAEWNNACERDHAELFARVRPDVPELFAWVEERFDATLYDDPWSPFCLIARSAVDAAAVHEYLDGYCRTVPNLVVVRNDIYARFSHAAYNKGTALTEIARQLGVPSSGILAAGDHLNDLPMLSSKVAQHLVTPANAIPLVQQVVREQGGYVAQLKCGHGIAEGIEALLRGKAHL
jgi:HAD superfamily hydrolase (TIGR01484 family)